MLRITGWERNKAHRGIKRKPAAPGVFWMLLLCFCLFSAQSLAQDGRLTLIDDVDFGIEDNLIAHWALSPDNRFLFGYGLEAENIAVFERDLVTGALSLQSATAVDVMVDRLAAMSLSSDGRFLFLAGYFDTHIQRFVIDPNTGAVALDEEFAVTVDAPITEMVMLNDTIYVATAINSMTNQARLVSFSVNASDGALTEQQNFTRSDTTTDLFISPDAAHFYVLEPHPIRLLAANQVRVYDMESDGLLTNERIVPELQITAEFTAGAGFSADGRQLFLTAEGPGSPPPTFLTQLQRDSASGALSLGQTLPFAAALLTVNANAVTVVDNDRTLVTVGVQGPNLYDIDTSSGSIMALPGVGNVSGSSRSVVADHAGVFLYEAYSEGVRVFSINGSNSAALPVPALHPRGVLLLFFVFMTLGVAAYWVRNQRALR